MPINRLSLLLLTTLLVATTEAPARGVERLARLRFIEVKNDGKVRFNVSFFEREGAIRFPVTTLDRSMVDVEMPEALEASATIRSLTTVGDAPAETKRAMVVVFSGGEIRGSEAPHALRTAVSESLSALPAAFLSVAAMAGDETRLIGESTPGRSENLVTVQRDILSLPQSGDDYSGVAALCYGASRFQAWDLSHFNAGDQKILILVGAGPGAHPAGTKNRCVTQLLDLGVRVYQVVWAGVSPDSLLSERQAHGGFVQRVKSAVDTGPALSNIVANLNGEYLIDAEIKDVPWEAQPLMLGLSFAYHGETVLSNRRRLEHRFPELSPPAPMPPPPKVVTQVRNNKLPAALCATAVLFILGIVLRRPLRKFIASVRCNACGRRVAKTHVDCPFRDRQVVARLVILDGSEAGLTVPLRLGDNLIGRAYWAQAHISGRGVAWLKHGTIRIEGKKALYVPTLRRRLKPLLHQVNGWPVSEARLLGTGSVLQVGERKLRFEVGPSTPGFG